MDIPGFLSISSLSLDSLSVGSIRDETWIDLLKEYAVSDMLGFSNIQYPIFRTIYDDTTCAHYQSAVQGTISGLVRRAGLHVLAAAGGPVVRAWNRTDTDSHSLG